MRMSSGQKLRVLHQRAEYLRAKVAARVAQHPEAAHSYMQDELYAMDWAIQTINRWLKEREPGPR